MYRPVFWQKILVNRFKSIPMKDRKFCVSGVSIADKSRYNWTPSYMLPGGRSESKKITVGGMENE